jgi:hypothetical protein
VSYDTPAAALTDALRLSQATSYKNAMGGLSTSGGEAVLYNLILAVAERVSNLLAQARLERRPSNEVADEVARTLMGRSHSRGRLGGVARAFA